MAARNLFLVDTPLALLAAAAAARRQGARAQLVLLEGFESADRFARALKRWRDNPFEAITRLPGGHEQLRRGPGAQRGLAAFARRIAEARELRRDTLAALRELDARFEPDAVWVGDDRKFETQHALQLAGERSGARAGRYLDAGLPSYLPRARWLWPAPRPGTSPWIAESWLALPRESLDQAPARSRHALPREWFTGRDLRRLSLLAAREFGVDRDALAGCSAVLVLPHSRALHQDAALLLRLRRLMEAAEACGRRIALKHHPREHESDPAGLMAEGAALALPKSLPAELLPPLLARAALLAGEASSALLAARWLRPDLVVCELGVGRGEDATRARALLARHGVGPLDETALS